MSHRAANLPRLLSEARRWFEDALFAGVTRQTAHQAVHGLIGMGLLEQTPDPASARRRLIRLTAEGQRVHERAQATIEVIETLLVDRIGPSLVRALRDALTADWGVPPLVTAP
ncbi:MarR family winged helix-turn-helix transcriptional regulator [Streptomyces sp. NPDC005706]|uniref:MarR family winged helix-turn-helix transcriptional regulator n=1 Tax=Streptomyces sp. NPDC005706 TaxID=3157169 RepID=UPI00340DD9DC